MVETVVVVLVTCLLLFGLLQLTHAFVNREVLRHASDRAARARAVGFNGWMCHKVMRVAAIPNAGRMVEPSSESFPDVQLREAIAGKGPGEFWDWALRSSPQSERGQLERARIPDYLASENDARAAYILDYERWDDISSSGLGGGGAGLFGDSRKLEVSLRQDYPLDIAVRALWDWVGATALRDRESLTLKADSEIEDHYSLYLDDQGY